MTCPPSARRWSRSSPRAATPNRPPPPPDRGRCCRVACTGSPRRVVSPRAPVPPRGRARRWLHVATRRPRSEEGLSMRRSIGLVLVGLGVLMLVLAPMSRWYAYPRLAVVSNDVAERVSTGSDVTVLDLGAVVRQEAEVERVTDIRSVRRIIPDQGE